MNHSSPRHVIFCDWPLNRNRGGPAGYLWHLRHGLQQNGHDAEVIFITPQDSAAGAGSKKIVTRLLDATARLSKPLWRFLKTYGPTVIARQSAQYLRTPLDQFFVAPEWEHILADRRYDRFHVHTTYGALCAHNSLTRLGRRNDVRLLLTSHCPQMPADEMADIMRSYGLTHKVAERVRSALLRVDLAAFRAADTIVAPCPEAFEPYYTTCADFAAAVAGKPMIYILTGIDEPVRADTVKEIFSAGAGLKLFYAGRHNTVKGYDRLSRVVPPFLDRSGAAMLVAGVEGPLYAPRHLRWTELGWTSNVPDLIAAADVFLLPNAQTYFDIVALEVMALGKPLIASATGGNKALAALSPGVMVFDNTDAGLAQALDGFAALSEQERLARGRANRHAYEAQLSAVQFAKNYLDLVVRS